MTPTELILAVQHVLDSDLRPLLHFHGGDVHIMEISPEGVVRLDYTGACHGCHLQMITHLVTMRARLVQIPGVSDVVADGIRLSQAAQERVAAAYSPCSAE